jgi:hypothetical protein
MSQLQHLAKENSDIYLPHHHLRFLKAISITNIIFMGRK